MSDLSCQEIADALKLWQSLVGPLREDEDPVTILAHALRAAEERGTGRASQEWLDVASKAQAAKVADVIEEFERRRAHG